VHVCGENVLEVDFSIKKFLILYAAPPSVPSAVKMFLSWVLHIHDSELMASNQIPHPPPAGSE